MRLHRWRYGILALAVFLALPIVSVSAAKCGEKDIEENQRCLRWVNLENGEAENKVFALPGEVDCSTAVVQSLTCWVGEDLNKKKLKSCYGLAEDEVEFDKENKKFYFKELPSATVECFSDKGYKSPIFTDNKPRFCKFAKGVQVTRQLEDVFFHIKRGRRRRPLPGMGKRRIALILFRVDIQRRMMLRLEHI